MHQCLLRGGILFVPCRNGFLRVGFSLLYAEMVSKGGILFVVCDNIFCMDVILFVGDEERG